ncbi:MAG TPA: ABC transporter permease [Blastocatellia bacterium]|nr:ABC transporter permease [Blastocatellia bacterium]HMZ18652.1 ABC transporter permease [Blastocatellia bacterium]HNG32939.1 ABC transporter permease [Blastocatellia bacterium]
MQNLFQDLRYALRTLLGKPGFSVIAIITLALGIGANTAIFSVINTVLLKPLPYKDADRLVAVWGKLLRTDQVELSPREMADFRERSRVFAQFAASERSNLNLTGNGDPVRLEGQAVTANMFSMLGASPLLGRTFTAEEDKANARVAVLSYGLWQKRLGGKADAVGKPILLDGKSYEVIGVMPGEFQFPPPGTNNLPGEIWVPRSLETETRLDAHNLFAIGQLNAGATFAQARAEMDGIVRQREQEDSRRQGTGFNLVPLQAQVGRQLRPALLILAGAVGFVLLIACANVANLLLASASVRQREITIRLALGASRLRIVRQLLTESLLLSSLGGGLGLLLAVWSSEAIRALGGTQIPRADQIGLDGVALGFTFLLSMLTGVVFGLVPALQASRADLNGTLKEGGRSGAAGGRHRLRSALVAVEIALSLMLLVGAGLLIKNFRQLLNTDPGFNTRNLLSLEVALTGERYGDSRQRSAFYRQALERLSSLPGVQAAAAVNHPPFSGRRGINVFRIEGRPEPTGMSDTPLADFRVISSGYFRMMDIPVLQGRAFNESDGADAPRVAIVNQAFVQRFLPGENPLGRRLSGGNEWVTVVGVVGDIRQSGLDQETAPHVYAPYLQLPAGRSGILLRTSVDPLSLAATVQKQVNAVDPDLPIYNLHAMDELIADSMAGRRLNLVLLTVFALTALALAAVGIYGVISYSVSQRAREIGIRLAIGAQRADVLKLIVRQGMIPVAIGMAAGIAGALALARVVATLLVGISANDPITFAAIVILLATVALPACFIPARRATKVDPIIVLRAE